MAFDLKSLLAYALDPRVLAVVGGYVGYQYLGKKKEGYMPYAYLGGGAVAGYFAGYLAQKLLKPDPFAGAQAQGQIAAQQPAKGAALQDPYLDMLDLDAPARRALPPHAAPRAVAQAIAQAPAPPPAAPIDVRAADADDSDLLDGLGYFEGSGEEGLGSYDASLDGDVDVDEVMRDAGIKN